MMASSAKRSLLHDDKKHAADEELFGLLLSQSSSTSSTTNIQSHRRFGNNKMEDTDKDNDNKKKYETQRTFDSSADLLENEEEVGPEPGEHQQQQQLHYSLRSSKVWDCRAIHWPPHSPKTLIKYGYSYVKSYHLLLEVSFLGAFVYLCYILPDYLVDAHHRPIPIQTTATGEALIDLTFDNDYHHNETIPGSLLNLLCVIFPISTYVLFGVFMGPRGDMHAALCMYLLTMGMKIFIVACIKNYAGYLRPSFYDMCDFNPQTLVCDNETTSARESFPSGHAATALSSMTILSLFLMGKVRGWTRQRGLKKKDDYDLMDIIWSPTPLFKVLALVAASPVFLGMFIATSRVRDNWHHPADIICGGIIGVSCAFLAHSLWYPSVYSPYAGIPLVTVEKILIERKKHFRLGEPKVDLDEIDNEL